MREHITEVENAGATKYGKPSEENTLKYETKYQLTLGHQHNHRQCVRCQQSYPRSGHQTHQETR